MRLNGNALSGTIPSELGALPNGLALNLSDNRLSGEVPASLDSNRPNIQLENNRCLWATECASFEPWLDAQSPGWSVASDPDCTPPPEACR